MKLIDDICVFVKKENISRNSLIVSMLINALLSIIETIFFSDITQSNPKYIGSYYVVINIIPTIVTVFIRFLFEHAYEIKERVMRERAKASEVLDDKTRSIQNKIILDDTHKPINDYLKEFGNPS